MDSEDRRQSPEDECPDDAVPQGLALLVLGQAEDQDGQDHRIVRAQQAFEDDE
jgi:hypothetical protein